MPDRLEVGDDLRTQCRHCGEQLHDHDRDRVYPDDGPPGSYHYVCACPDATGWSPATNSVGVASNA